MDDKKILKTNNTTSKNFDYSKEGVRLAFTLRTDVKIELKAFAELLEVALVDVKKEIENVN